MLSEVITDVTHVKLDMWMNQNVVLVTLKEIPLMPTTGQTVVNANVSLIHLIKNCNDYIIITTLIDIIII